MPPGTVPGGVGGVRRSCSGRTLVNSVFSIENGDLWRKKGQVRYGCGKGGEEHGQDRCINSAKRDGKAPVIGGYVSILKCGRGTILPILHELFPCGASRYLQAKRISMRRLRKAPCGVQFAAAEAEAERAILCPGITRRKCG